MTSRQNSTGAQQPCKIYVVFKLLASGPVPYGVRVEDSLSPGAGGTSEIMVPSAIGRFTYRRRNEWESEKLEMGRSGDIDEVAQTF